MSIKRAYSLTIAFPAISAAHPPTRLTGITFATGNVQISKDGGAFANATNLPSEISTSGRYSHVLTSSEMDAGWVLVKITNSLMQDCDIMVATSNHPSGQVVTNGSNTATTFQTNRAETATNYWQDSLLLFTSGSLVGQQSKITGYNGGTFFITVGTAFTGTPSAGDEFIIVNL